MNDLSIQRVLPRLPAIATWVLALAIGLQAALIVRDLIPQPKSTPAPAVVESSAPRPLPSESMDLSGILNAHLFGQATAEPTGDASTAPQTQLSLVLAGTIAMDDPEKGLGIIGPAANNAKVYSVGEMVDGGVRLHAVYNDRVILDRNGQMEALYLPRQSSGVAAITRAPTPQPGAAFANRLRDMANQNPDMLTSVMRPQPVFADGKQRGYRVYPGRNRSQFQQLGLAPGDLITAINGTPLDDPARGMEIFRTIANASQVTVTIERRGQQQQLMLDMTQLNSQVQDLNAAPPAGPPPVEQVQQPPPNPESH